MACFQSKTSRSLKYLAGFDNRWRYISARYLKGNPVIGLISAQNGLFFDLCCENPVQTGNT